MISTILFCLSSIAAVPHSTPAPAPFFMATSVAWEDHAKEYDAKKKAAGKDPEKLWELFLWCEAYGLDKQGRSCLRSLLRVDPEHREAHLKLGHIEYEGKWFKTQKKLDKYKAAEEQRIADEQGLVKWKGEWVKREDLPYLERGMIRDDDGKWISEEELAKSQGGWVKQDLTWISPDEVPNIEKGLWKCGSKWLSLEEANKYHSELSSWWVIPGDHFILYTTCDRDVAMQIMDHMDRGQRDMARILGSSPKLPPHVAMLRSAEQYNQFAKGDDSEGVPPTELLGLSSIHNAYFGDFWLDGKTGKLHGGGVGYWDASTENGNRFGPHSARHASALSLVEAADPSPKATENLRKKGNAYIERFIGDFYKEKKIPSWYRNGAASYVGRYFIDQFVKAGGNANWARDWSISNIAGKGGLRPIKDIFEDELSVDTFDDSAKLLNELGLVMAFALDGECQPVIAAMAGAKAAIRKGEGQKKAFKELKAAILKNEAALHAFAGI